MFVLIAYEDPATAVRVEEGFRLAAPEVGIQVASTAVSVLRGGPSFDGLPDGVVLEVERYERADLGVFHATMQRHHIPLFVLAEEAGAARAETHGLNGATLVLDREQALLDVKGLAAAIIEYLDVRRATT